MAPSNAIQGNNTSVSVVVLAFNEARNLPSTVQSINEALEDKFAKYEIIIINDGSRDETGQVAESLAKQNSHLKVIHNPQNMGCGFTFIRGVTEASCEYVWLIPGDGEISADSIETIANHIGTADMVIPYVLNFGIRPLSRRIVSWGYTALINILFLRNLHYYNGPCAIRSDLAKSVPTVNSCGFAFMAPILLRLIKQKHSYVEVGITLQPRRYGWPSVSSLCNIFSALKTIAWLFWDINLGERLRRDKSLRTKVV